MRNANRHIKPSRVPLTLAVLACLQVAPALAQETTQQEAKASSTSSSTQRATDLDKVTVTGSLIRRADYETTSPVFTINAETNAKQGQVNVAEFLQKSAIGSAETQITHQFGGFVVDGGTGVQTVSLRGLGANRTLVLLDGQRPGPAGTRGAVGAFDLNVIPTAILQRAEIVKDGSSSIYGSDAVAGVVNIITRQNFEGAEIGGSFGGADQGGLHEQNLKFVGGLGDLDTDGYNILFSLQGYNRERLDQDERNLTKSGIYTDKPGGRWNGWSASCRPCRRRSGRATTVRVVNSASSCCRPTAVPSASRRWRTATTPLNAWVICWLT